MSETLETIEIQRIHDSDTWQIVRTITDRVNKEELVKIYKQILEAYNTNLSNTQEAPKQLEDRMKSLGKERGLLQVRLDEFEKHAKKFADEEPKEEKKP